jgi:hypothetical protein
MGELLDKNELELCGKISQVLSILMENSGDLHDDTYTEKMISGFGQKLIRLNTSGKAYLFWISSGAQGFIENLFSDQSSGKEIENFGLKLLSECVLADSRIAAQACSIVEQFSRFVKLLFNNYTLVISIEL